MDDGKSTLIGRLLLRRQVDPGRPARAHRRGLARAQRQRHLDLALLTDGLRAEREQGITIDVAHRYFATPRRRFILADTPGHEQYTRNMVTGASTAEVAIVLVDARHGVVEQTRRHAAVAALLRVGHVVLAVNKMDLVDWSEEVFDRIVADFDCFASKVGLGAVAPLPMSALHGDNVVASRPSGWPGTRGRRCSSTSRRSSCPPTRPGELRFPVQWVLRGEDARATPAASPAANCGRATRSSRCRAASARGSPRSRRSTGRWRRPSPAQSVSVRLDRELDLVARRRAGGRRVCACR